MVFSAGSEVRPPKQQRFQPHSALRANDLSQPAAVDAEAARTMVRDWAMLGTCRVSQLPPITLSSFSELCETERLDEDWDSCLLLRFSARPSLHIFISY